MSTRLESDSMGQIEVDERALWGAQTQRSLENFKIGIIGFPCAFIHAFARVKKAAALSNLALHKLSQELCNLIVQACDEIIARQHNDQFPLVIWQTGSGTQTNMNVNEVIANRGNELAGHPRGANSPLHPNDHVNLSQSSNDVFPTVMHVATAEALHFDLLPALDNLIASLHSKTEEFRDQIKCGRTHLMDATPITLGQEFSGYHQQISYSRQQISAALPAIHAIALGGSAVGTGLNTHPQWSKTVAQHISVITGIPFETADNKFSALAAHDALVDLHGRLRLLATALFKIANDLRLMASGPMCGLAEISLPANEPGSSIMPGKVNPTQIEALTMVAVQVMGNDTAISIAGSQGQLELNVFKPLIIHNILQSISLLSDAIRSFDRNCLQGITANQLRLEAYANRSLMLVTALTPVIGYEAAAQVIKRVMEQDETLKEAVLAMGLMTEVEFDRLAAPRNMLGPNQI